MAILGGLSPLLWMMQWFLAARFVKRPNPPLEIHRSLSSVAVAAATVALFAGFLGRTVYF